MVDKKLTIFFITNNYRPYSAGVVSAIDATVEQLKKLGHRVCIITLDFGYECSLDESIICRVPCQIKFSFRSYPLAFPLFPSHYLYKLVKSVRPDILHVHHPFLLGSCAARIGNYFGIPVVFTLHMLYEKHTHHVPLPQGVIQFLVQKRVRRFCNTVGHVIAPSYAVKQYLLERKVTSKISVIPSGILPIFKDTPLDIKHDRERIELLYVGRFVPEKNINLLLDVFSLLPRGSFHLTIAGFGVEYDKLCLHAYGTLGLSHNDVEFRYRPSKKVLTQLYQTAHLFLFASRSETQAMVLAEAMACGTPVVAFKGFAIDDIVKPGVNGMLVESVQEMAEGILTLMHDSHLYARFQQGARATAQAYDPEVTVQRLVEVYRELLGSQ